MDVSLCFASARELAAQIRARKVSARELMAASLAQIRKLNPQLNAIVAQLDDDACMALADQADRVVAAGRPTGPLHGLPTAFKDLEAAVGFPQTKGSTVFKDFRPDADSVIVERVRRAGAIPIGKTNVPEFGMGSQTYNRVYGTTVNPYDPTKTAGGSSGGAAVAVATGMLPIADGGDLGGSLRNPANFNNIVALRPSVGLVPIAPAPLPFVGVSTKGMLARSVSDVAFGLSVVAGADPRDPQSYASNAAAFAAPLDRDWRGTRIAWSLDLGGLPVDRRVLTVLAQQRRAFEDLGCIVEDACPDLRMADEIFLTLRRWASWHTHKDLLKAHRSQLKPEAISEIEQGGRLTGDDIGRALVEQGRLLDRLRRFHQQYDFLVCAVNQVPPFDAAEPWPTSIEGVVMDDYVSWMKSAYWISATCCPSISVPAGFTDAGLPVGVQIVGRYRDDLELLQFAHAFERATEFGKRRPPNT
ncbi:MAG TPA: amidase [Vicinamibacterales bacterium]|nr:amidase [Vicinamibacterales bacterium]